MSTETPSPSPEKPRSFMSRPIPLPRLPFSAWPWTVASVLMCYHTIVLLGLYSQVHWQLCFSSDVYTLSRLLRTVDEAVESGEELPKTVRDAHYWTRGSSARLVRGMREEARNLLDRLEMYHVTGLVAFLLGLIAWRCRSKWGSWIGLAAGIQGLLMAGILM